MKRTYYIISTTNAQIFGWTVFGTYNNRREAEKALPNIPDFEDETELHCDIEAQTLYKNARIASKTEAKKYGIDDKYFENI